MNEKNKKEIVENKEERAGRPELLKFAMENMSPLNNNVLVMGNHGSGRTMEYILPNILQADGSYVVLDKKGELYEKTGNYLKDKGYDVKVLRLKEPMSGNHYDPISYIREDEDIYTLIDCIIDMDHFDHIEPRFKECEKTLFYALFMYMIYHMPQGKRSFGTIRELLEEVTKQYSKGSEEKPFDLRFEKVGQENERYVAYLYYKRLKKADPRILTSVIISAQIHLQLFFVLQDAGFMEKDELNLEDFFDRKCALFIRVGENEPKGNRVLASLVCRQILCAARARRKKVGDSAESVPVRVMLDNFADACYIPDLWLDICMAHEYGISYDIVLEREEQLKELYSGVARKITDNCATTIYFARPIRCMTRYQGKEKDMEKESG